MLTLHSGPDEVSRWRIAAGVAPRCEEWLVGDDLADLDGRLIPMSVSNCTWGAITLLSPVGLGRLGMEPNVSTFDARIRLPGQTRLPLNVVVDITDDRISFIKDEKPLGAWPLAEVEVDFRADGFYIRLEQEEIALSVTDVDGFAGALGLGRRPPVTDGRGGNGAAPPAEPNGRGISSRLHRISPEEQLGDLRQRISELAADITNESIAPPEVFGQWLRLLKELNVRHGQGAIPTALFYRLNTELLDLIPAPRREPHPELQTVGVGPRL